MTGACFYDEFVKILTRFHLLLHKSPLEVGAAVLVQLPLVVFQGKVLQQWSQWEESDNYIFGLHICICQMTGRQKCDLTLIGNDWACCLQNILDCWNDNDRCWKNATPLFSLRTFIFTMTRAEKQQFLSLHFWFPDDRSWKKRQLFCLHTFTFTMNGTGKTNTFMSPSFHIHGACVQTITGIDWDKALP